MTTQEHHGKSGSRVVLDPRWVEKYTTHTDEPKMMKAHPEVFCPIISQFDTKVGGVSGVVYKMPHLCAATNPSQLLYGLPLLMRLWHAKEPESTFFAWRELLIEHLHRQVTKHGLFITGSEMTMRAWVSALVMAIPDEVPVGVIHGDPTLSNLVHTNEGITRYYWIDPLNRPFIPNYKSVDVGKMLQSCWGYESVLDNHGGLEMNFTLASLLCDLSVVPLRNAFKWCVIHMIRLLPYQRGEHRAIFERHLKEVAWCSTLTEP